MITAFEQTRLAVRAAQRIVEPGGFANLQLFVNRRGFDKIKSRQTHTQCEARSYAGSHCAPGDQIHRPDLRGRTHWSQAVDLIKRLQTSEVNEVQNRLRAPATVVGQPNVRLPDESEGSVGST